MASVDADKERARSDRLRPDIAQSTSTVGDAKQRHVTRPLVADNQDLSLGVEPKVARSAAARGLLPGERNSTRARIDSEDRERALVLLPIRYIEEAPRGMNVDVRPGTSDHAGGCRRYVALEWLEAT